MQKSKAFRRKQKK